MFAVVIVVVLGQRCAPLLVAVAVVMRGHVHDAFKDGADGLGSAVARGKEGAAGEGAPRGVEAEAPRVFLPELRVDDFLGEHLVDHQEGCFEEEDGVDAVALLGVEAREFGARVTGRAAAREVVLVVADVVFDVAQVRDDFEAVVLDLFDEREDVGAVDDGVAVADYVGDDELVGLFDFLDLVFDL